MGTSERTPRRVIGDGETAADGEVAGLADEQLLELHRQLVLMRTFDERAVVYQRQGRIGTYAIYWGHEAIQVGAHFALDAATDWVFPSYRESAIGLLRGIDPATVLAWWRGHPAGWWNPQEHLLGGISVPIASQVPHAAGAAWGMRLRGEPGCALVFFGDGATSEGAFHEGVNLAAVTDAPVVLLCSNNGWAISTPYERQSRAAALADKAVGYGIPGVRVDGGDVLAVHEAVRDAVTRARAGDGPTLVEAVHYRIAPHGTADDPSLYREPGRAEAARSDECLVRYEGYLRRRGLLDDDAAAARRAEAVELVKAGMRAVEQLPAPDPALVFDTTYAQPPADLLRQRDEALAAFAEAVA
ncbi:thiamine pyrophosphate-dependent enzyme [Conexibacter woesei]|uniref:2-oxoisovalerate dehydrogenase subunit alpha n=1 Tax=Conexibacter woesei (strain DSM 14684 / CCUG 47730 / CIP 108061 / JCM 11494 / NBRC 100937 / ID131577) TaxID=469383 RepID=D3F5E9_CONWI|nr:thiamine pyrophosphate-dependent enzyme [Conexibacter woesei]ADB50616.1 3-methyl-2-oxobutanoate dehydrogenase (2- methylpropanoyl-transferring) [Conexibacter woesei DSM 14684]